MTLTDIGNHVINEGFGIESRVYADWYWSSGIRYAYDSDPELWQPYVEKALSQVKTGNYGGFYELDEEPTPGREYYICESPFGNDVSTGIIMHREN